MDTSPRLPPFALLAAMTALGPLAQNIFIPSMPALPAVFDVAYGKVQLTLTLYFIGFAIAQLIYGPLSDRFGRRPVMLGGLSLFCLGTILSMVAPTLWLLILGRFIQSIGGCAGMVLSRAVVRDVHDREKAASVIAYVVMAMVIAPMFAPLVGGLLDERFGWRASFAVTAVFGLVVLLAAITMLNETLAKPQPLPDIRSMGRAYASLARRPAMQAYTGCAAFLIAGFFAFLVAAPYIVIQVMGRPPSEYGLYFIVPALTYMAGNFLAGQVSQKVGVDRMMTLGSLVTWAGALFMLLVALAGWQHPLALFGPMVLFSFGNGLGLPNAMAGAISVDPSIAGTASGLLGFAQMMVGALWGTLAGWLVADTQLPLAVLMAVSATIAVFCAGMLRHGSGSTPTDHVRPPG